MTDTTTTWTMGDRYGTSESFCIILAIVENEFFFGWGDDPTNWASLPVEALDRYNRITPDPAEAARRRHAIKHAHMGSTLEEMRARTNAYDESQGIDRAGLTAYYRGHPGGSHVTPENIEEWERLHGRSGPH